MREHVVDESKQHAQGLYDPAFEHDNCGIGAVVDVKGRKSHATVEQALKIVENFFSQKQIDISLIYIAKEDFLALIILLISSYLISLIPSFLVRKVDIDNLFKEDK